MCPCWPSPLTLALLDNTQNGNWIALSTSCKVYNRLRLTLFVPAPQAAGQRSRVLLEKDWCNTDDDNWLYWIQIEHWRTDRYARQRYIFWIEVRTGDGSVPDWKRIIPERSRNRQTEDEVQNFSDVLNVANGGWPRPSGLSLERSEEKTDDEISNKKSWLTVNTTENRRLTRCETNTNEPDGCVTVTP